VKEAFRKFATKTSDIVGSAWAFIAAVVIILAWAISGPIFGFSDTWQLVINTGTTIITFLMVFLIQNTQNRDAKAIHLKLDELIRASHGARDSLVDLERLSDKDLCDLKAQFERLSEKQPALVYDDIETVKDELEERESNRNGYPRS
jgi:low affinity Fe/Cu permease